MTDTFPTLYKKTSTGAIQFWDILVDTAIGFPESDDVLVATYGVIITRYGQVGTESPQETQDVITKGKNVGKKNETTPYQQAVAEAAAKHEKQRKKGYVDSQEKAEAGELDEVVQGGISPMLAHKFTEQGHKIVYPCYAQPKLDGMRCIAIVEEGKATMWSRQRNPINSAPHLIEELERCFPTGKVILDGELYNHEMKHDFERFISIARQQDKVHRDHKLLQYHVYDVAHLGNANWRQRRTWIELMILDDPKFDYIRCVETQYPVEESEVPVVFEEYRDMGYEGCMLRNEEGLYLNKRSYDLQKVKEFDDGEFRITGITEGRGKLAGHVGAFVCVTKDGNEFEAKMEGDLGRLKQFWDDHSLWAGKMLTVRYQGLTSKSNVPRFPIGVTFRDYEE